MPMYCPYCGTRQLETAKFCMNCGQPLPQLEKKAPPESSAPNPTEATPTVPKPEIPLKEKEEASPAAPESESKHESAPEPEPEFAPQPNPESGEDIAGTPENVAPDDAQSGSYSWNYRKPVTNSFRQKIEMSVELNSEGLHCTTRQWHTEKKEEVPFRDISGIAVGPRASFWAWIGVGLAIAVTLGIPLIRQLGFLLPVSGIEIPIAILVVDIMVAIELWWGRFTVYHHRMVIIRKKAETGQKAMVLEAPNADVLCDLQEELTEKSGIPAQTVGTAKAAVKVFAGILMGIALMAGVFFLCLYNDAISADHAASSKAEIQSASDLEHAVAGTWKITEIKSRNGQRIENMTDSGRTFFDADHSLTIKLDDLVSGEWSVVDGDTLELRFPDGITRWTVKMKDSDSFHLTLKSGDFGEMNEMTFARLAEDTVSTGKDDVASSDNDDIIATYPDPVVTEQNTPIACGDYHTVFLYDDSTVGAVGDNSRGQCNVADWTDIVSVSAGDYHTVGLQRNGTVVAVGNHDNGQCNVSGWTDIVEVSAGGFHTVGLRSDGTVVAAGSHEEGQCNVSGWMGIVEVSAGGSHTVGLRSDGTVVATGWNSDGQCNVSSWTDIIAVSAGWSHTVGLRSDGTVVATGWNSNGQCNVSGWMDIEEISAGGLHTVGLRSDGTIVAVGATGAGQCSLTSDWMDVAKVSAGLYHTVGLQNDGTLVAAGDNSSGQCNFYGNAPASEETLQNFVSSGEYWSYVSDWETAPTRYAILDIGYDGISDLVLSTEESDGFSNFILFTVDPSSNNVIPVNQEGFGYQGYCYGGLRYSWESGALTFEHLNADGTGYHEFGQINLYIVEGAQLVWQKGLCYDTAQGTGQRIYSLEGADGTSQSLSEEEYNNLMGEIQPVEYKAIF